MAKSGGNYTTITAALNAITPSATKPYVIEVWPGTYVESVTMKSYVHLRGSGRDVTTIQGLVQVLWPVTEVTISGFTVLSQLYLYNNSSSPSTITVTENTIKQVTNSGIFINWVPSGTITITGNIITANAYNGIHMNCYSQPTIKISGNTITGNGASPPGPLYLNGITSSGCSPMIEGNTITGNLGYGVYNVSSSSPRILYNQITNNGGASYTDIFVDSNSVPNISFNVYDDITGTTGTGLYNVDSNGNLAPAP